MTLVKTPQFPVEGTAQGGMLAPATTMPMATDYRGYFEPGDRLDSVSHWYGRS